MINELIFPREVEWHFKIYMQVEPFIGKIECLIVRPPQGKAAGHSRRTLKTYRIDNPHLPLAQGYTTELLSNSHIVCWLMEHHQAHLTELQNLVRQRISTKNITNYLMFFYNPKETELMPLKAI